MPFSAHNLILLSDVHLGSDLVHHAQPDAPSRLRSSERRNRDLAALLDWYRTHPHAGRPWRLVIAGDFIDFAGMSVPYELATETAPNEEEKLNGLGNARGHSLAKLRLVMEHDSVVIRGLARFLEAGNSLVIVRGNHDVDWHWEAVQEEFRRGLAVHALVAADQVEFAPWFYYEEGVVFVEHGHQYDAYCSYEHVLHPVSPSDPRRTVRSLSEILLRYVVRPTRGMSEAGHGAAVLSDYLRFAFGLGIGGMLGLARRFLSATRALLALWREHLSEAAHRVKREHEARLEHLSRRHRIQLERLIDLARLWRPPVTRSVFTLLPAVMLDRVLLAALGVVLVASFALLVQDPITVSLLVAGTVITLIGVGAIWRRMRDAIEPSAQLRERSALVARLFPAAFVVMGHTHLPETGPAAKETTYVNLGAWAEEDAPDGRVPLLPATRTHLVLACAEEGPIAELMTWDGDGPRPFTEAGGEQKSRFLELFRKAS
ncbi:MAG TPA: metallophosphoesterase [Polyangiaceae bacterium]